MKRFTLLLIILLSSAICGQRGTGAIKMGYFNPSSSDGGFIIGFEAGKYFDRNFNIGFSIDWFNRNYIDQELVEEFDFYYGEPGGTLNEIRAKTNLHDIPLMLNMTGISQIGLRASFYLSGGIGAEVLLIFYRDFRYPDENELKTAFDFNWRFGGGLLYEIGRRSDLFIELLYHHSQPSWQYEVEDPWYNLRRVFERRYDMSGLMLRAGVRFYY